MMDNGFGKDLDWVMGCEKENEFRQWFAERWPFAAILNEGTALDLGMSE